MFRTPNRTDQLPDEYGHPQESFTFGFRVEVLPNKETFIINQVIGGADRLI
jgi:hypothetical protein